MVEEKNRLITLYIENKVKELENMSMFVSKDNVQKVINNFLNRNEDIEIIKTKIDTIFNNSISAYKENLEKMGYTNIFSTPSIQAITDDQELICIRMCEVDYHFMRYDIETNAWYHKPGLTAVLKYNYVPSNNYVVVWRI